MKIHYQRIGRDFAVIVLFCGLFWAVVVLINLYQDPVSPPPTDFSDDRVALDKAVQSRDGDQALIHLTALLQRDPYNGRAKILLARNLRDQLRDLKREFENSVNDDTIDETKLVLNDRKIQSLLDQAISAYQQASQHLRYRPESLGHLAILYADNQQFDEALLCLEEFFEFRWYFDNGIRNIAEFKPLQSNAQFQKLATAEDRIKGNFQSTLTANENKDKKRPSMIANLQNFLNGKSVNLNNDLAGLWNKIINFVRKFFK